MCSLYKYISLLLLNTLFDSKIFFFFFKNLSGKIWFAKWVVKHYTLPFASSLYLVFVHFLMALTCKFSVSLCLLLLAYWAWFSSGYLSKFALSDDHTLCELILMNIKTLWIVISIYGITIFMLLSQLVCEWWVSLRFYVEWFMGTKCEENFHVSEVPGGKQRMP